MNKVIRKTAAANDIFEDVETSFNKAKAKGGTAADLAEQRLAPVLKLAAATKDQLALATKAALPLIAALGAADEHADKAIGKVSDDIWNAVGRPAADPALAILFPGGNSFYVDGDVAEQPDRMDLLVELLGAGVHPKLPAADAQAAIATLKAEGTALRAAVSAAQGPRAKMVLYERVVTAIARAAAIELANFKRLLKANGMSEAEIHTIIPDRGRPEAKKPE